MSAYAPALGFLVVVAFILALGYSGIQPPDYVIEYGTLFLVLVTLANVIQNGQIIRGAEKERELTQGMLIEHRKSAIIELIAHGVDELDADLRSDRMTLNETPTISDERVLPPLLRRFDPPGDRTLSDIEREYSNLRAEFEEYRQLRDSYVEIHSTLKNDLEEQIPDRLSDEQRQTLIEVVQACHPDSPNDKIAVAMLSNMATTFAIAAFGAPTPHAWYNEGSKNWIDEDWEMVREAALSLDKDPQFSSQFAELISHRAELLKFNEQISPSLNEARERFKETYDIYESEITKESISSENSSSRKRR